MKVKLNEYIVSFDNETIGDFKATRYNQPWRTLTGDNLILAFMFKLEDARNIIDRYGNKDDKDVSDFLEDVEI